MQLLSVLFILSCFHVVNVVLCGEKKRKIMDCGVCGSLVLVKSVIAKYRPLQTVQHTKSRSAVVINICRAMYCRGLAVENELLTQLVTKAGQCLEASYALKACIT